METNKRQTEEISSPETSVNRPMCTKELESEESKKVCGQQHYTAHLPGYELARQRLRRKKQIFKQRMELEREHFIASQPTAMQSLRLRTISQAGNESICERIRPPNQLCPRVQQLISERFST
ncbi:unnamed protein product [Dicrocoelium dendriticum]|nr:unnamed protein product [Dicrocoelium dendriticum]